MNEEFKKFKNRILRHAIIESVVAGLAAGLIVVAAILLPLSLNFIYINAGIYVAAGVGTALVVGGVTFLLLRPNDKKVARRLDRDLALNEKAQTMVAYRSSQDSMALIQREDASGRLASAGVASVPFRRLWQCIAAAAVAVALFAASLTVALLSEPRPAAAEEYTPTRQRIYALYDLIDSVEGNTRFTDECKSAITGQIYTILELIYDEENDLPLTVPAERQIEVAVNAMVNIDIAVEEMIDADAFGLAFSEATEETLLSDMGIHIASLTVDTTRQGFSSIKSRLYADSVDPVPADISQYSALISQCAEACLSVNATLYNAFVALSDGLSEIAGYSAGTGEDAAQLAARVNDALDDVIDEASIVIGGEVGNQASVRSDGRGVIYRIQSILDIPDEYMPELTAVVEDVVSEPENPGGEEEEDPDEGGGGSGETVFPGDDVIYGYSDEDEAYGYYEYGELLNKYQGIADRFKEDGNLSEEYIAFLNNFYNALRNGELPGLQP